MATKPFRENIISTPYTERQLVVVLPDDVVDAAQNEEADAARSDRPIDWGKVAIAVARTMTNSLATTLVDVTSEALKAWAKARQNGLNVLQIRRSEALNLQFPPGHPRDGVLYIGHPTIPKIYYTIASFHRMAFEHKFAEAVDLLMHLGATEIRVEHIRGWSREFATTISTLLPTNEQISASGSGKSATKKSLIYEATLKGSNTPKLPESLVWFPHEPTWQSIAKGRMSFGLTKFSLTVNYEDDFGVNVGLKASAQRAGLELGGNFEDHKATTWVLSGIFSDD